MLVKYSANKLAILISILTVVGLFFNALGLSFKALFWLLKLCEYLMHLFF